MKFIVCILATLLYSLSAAEPAQDTQKSIPEMTARMVKHAGYFPYYRDHSGKIWLQIERWDQQFLYVNSLPAGVGSNDIGTGSGAAG